MNFEYLFTDVMFSLYCLWCFLWHKLVKVCRAGGSTMTSGNNAELISNAVPNPARVSIMMPTRYTPTSMGQTAQSYVSERWQELCLPLWWKIVFWPFCCLFIWKQCWLLLLTRKNREFRSRSVIPLEAPEPRRPVCYVLAPPEILKNHVLAINRYDYY